MDSETGIVPRRATEVYTVLEELPTNLPCSCSSLIRMSSVAGQVLNDVTAATSSRINNCVSSQKYLRLPLQGGIHRSIDLYPTWGNDKESLSRGIIPHPAGCVVSRSLAKEKAKMHCYVPPTLSSVLSQNDLSMAQGNLVRQIKQANSIL